MDYKKKYDPGNWPKIPRIALWVLLLGGLLYVVLNTAYVHCYGMYTVAIAEDVRDGPRGITTYYKYSIDGVEYEKSKQTLKLKIPEVNKMFLIKYREGNPGAPEFFLGTDVPDCFEYGASYSELTCPPALQGLPNHP